MQLLILSSKKVYISECFFFFFSLSFICDAIHVVMYTSFSVSKNATKLIHKERKKVDKSIQVPNGTPFSEKQNTHIEFDDLSNCLHTAIETECIHQIMHQRLDKGEKKWRMSPIKSIIDEEKSGIFSRYSSKKIFCVIQKDVIFSLCKKMLSSKTNYLLVLFMRACVCVKELWLMW